MPNTPLRSEDAYGEILTAYRNVNSRGDYAAVSLYVENAYVNDELYDDFESDEGGEWDTSGTL